MTITPNSLAMPYSNLVHFSFEDKLRATRLAGYEQVSLMPAEVREIMATGLTLKEMVSVAADHGVRITRLDPLDTWPRIWKPTNMSEAYIARIGESIDGFFDLAEGLGCTAATLNATFPLNAMPIEEVTEHFAAICKRAREHGVVCDLEFIPLWGVPTLAMAWQIIRDAAQPNGGMVFDIWHLVRSHSDATLLETIPGSIIHCVQLNDGPLELPPGVTIEEDCYNRFFPGDGDFPNAEIIRILARIGGLNEVGPEVFSPMLEGMSVEAVAEKSRRSIETVLAAASAGTA